MRMSARVLASAVLIVAVAGAAGASETAATGPQEARVVAVTIDPRTHVPTVVLEGKRDKRLLQMSIDLAQVTAIAVPLNGVTPPRPLTHDLFLTLFGRLKVTLNRVVITDVRADVYYATVTLTSAAGEMVLDSRPSDAIALAIRAKVPVLVEDRVFEKAGGPIAPRKPHI